MTHSEISQNSSIRSDKANKLLHEFENAVKHGFSINVIDITQQHMNGSNYIVGAEIMFDEKISHDMIEKIKEYIESKYNFYVDIDKYYAPHIKIIVIRYDI